MPDAEGRYTGKEAIRKAAVQIIAPKLATKEYLDDAVFKSYVDRIYNYAARLPLTAETSLIYSDAISEMHRYNYYKKSEKVEPLVPADSGAGKRPLIPGLPQISPWMLLAGLGLIATVIVVKS